MTREQGLMMMGAMTVKRERIWTQPILTANNSDPSMIVSASDEYLDFRAHRAFNGSTNTNQDCWLTISTSETLTIVFDRELTISSIKITNRNERDEANRRVVSSGNVEYIDGRFDFANSDVGMNSQWEMMPTSLTLKTDTLILHLTGTDKGVAIGEITITATY